MSHNPFNNQVARYKDMRPTCPTEESEQIALVQWLKIKKLPHTHIANEGKFNPQYMKKRSALGVNSGFPDMVIFLPHKLLCIELKRRPITTKTGKVSTSHTKVSDNQRDWLDTLECYSYVSATVAYGCQEAIDIINKEMNWK